MTSSNLIQWLESCPIPPDGKNPDNRRLIFDEGLGDYRDIRYASPEEVPRPDHVPEKVWADEKIRARIQNHVYRGYSRFRVGPEEVIIAAGPKDLMESNKKYHT